ncbi:MAG: hypothetical protein AAGD11_10700 [Planctomycetota bacterium]
MNVTLPIDGPYDLTATFWLMSMGKGNPCLRHDGNSQLRTALNTPLGPVCVVARQTESSIEAELEGSGAEWLRPHLTSFFGLDFQPPQIKGLRKLRQIAYDLRGLRLVRMPTISTSLVQIILQQLISYRDACYGWRKLAQRYGSLVPGCDDLWFPPTADALSKLSSPHFIECGVLPQHGRRIVAVSRVANELEATWDAGQAPDAIGKTSERLLKLTGVGPWTVGLLRGGAQGDADAEVLGDYSMPKLVSYFFENNLAAADQATDEEMLRLLEPYRPHRFYVLTLINRGAKHPPRRGPRRKSLRERF